ncbi:hypothetical protein CSC42_0766 [Pseudomonas aeruginosa]|nr:hypothetical protein CSC42_0766 [Pseudomonas aeruginosa]
MALWRSSISGQRQFVVTIEHLVEADWSVQEAKLAKAYLRS